MFRNSSLLPQPASGFVPFSDGGAIDAPIDDAAALVPAALRARLPVPAALEPTPAAADGLGFRRAAWQPASTVSVRFVEAAVLLAITGYFTFGLGRLAGLI